MKRLLFALLPLVAGAIAVAGEALELTDCRLSAIDGLVNRTASCGTLPVAENRADPQGRSIDLRVVRFPAATSNPSPDPVFFLAGGPGQSAVESFPAALGALAEARRDRDIVLIDQRGTGESNPLRCPPPEDFRDLLRSPAPEEIATAARSCLDTLDGDTRFYTTGDAADDIEAVRVALGYEQLNLYGISYGTRLAQVYLRRYPAPVRSVALDGVVPTDLLLGTEHAINLETALENLFNRCQQSASCSGAFPDVLASYHALKEKVRESPVPLVVDLPLSGESLAIDMNGDILALVLRLLAYAPESQALLPLLVHEAATEGEYGRLAAMAMMVLESLQGTIYRGLESSVMCAEDVPHFPVTPQHPDTLMGDSLLEVSRQHCAHWPTGDVPADFHVPFTTQVPVLLLSGEFDPVTPPRYGERALEQYPRGRHLVAAGQGHGVAARGCLPRLLADFYREAAAEDLDAACLDALGDTPFFTTLLGSEP